MFSLELIAYATSRGVKASRLEDICNGCNVLSWIYSNALKREEGFREACNFHDVDYYLGGTRTDRLRADKRFRQCVKDTGRPVRAWIFYIAVRLFGWWYWSNEK